MSLYTQKGKVCFTSEANVRHRQDMLLNVSRGGTIQSCRDGGYACAEQHYCSHRRRRLAGSFVLILNLDV